MESAYIKLLLLRGLPRTLPDGGRLITRSPDKRWEATRVLFSIVEPSLLGTLRWTQRTYAILASLTCAREMYRERESAYRLSVRRCVEKN